jgi:molybdenum cofactor cytidylyltransferase
VNFGVVILAAGASKRMGRPKLLLPWNGTTVIGHLLEQWRAVGAARMAVACAPGNRALFEELDRLAFPMDQRIINPQPDRGMFSSIQCAAGWAGWRPDLDQIAIALGDQPHVRLETLHRLIEFVTAHPGSAAQPSRGGHGRHPVFLPLNVFARLPAAKEESLKQFLRHGAVAIERCEMDDAGLDLDLDEPADYERARKGMATSI